ncbi:protein arginine N-methyltransferas-like protein 3 [Rhizodiscina lignyota]|uniref:type I protein arginine methyltransferase n=1 Tax=Rhizodiscina lignyota TaxID=1504668 RepID=A0A9P4IBF8_9PEZI|nr:protein arginine N-methyltransferas-like protein 3 [Rhizodiscina lignyota]
MAPEERSGSLSDADEDSSVGALDLGEDKDWEDAENDEERLTFVSFLDDATFSDLPSMLRHCKERYQFDFVTIVHQLGLDFLENVKLVNYIRNEVKSGNKAFDVNSKDVFSDDKYLQPVLEDDAVLFSLDDLPIAADKADVEQPPKQTVNYDDAIQRVSELEDKLRNLQNEYASYKHRVERTLDERWGAPTNESSAAQLSASTERRDTSYFDSYSYNDIHETMLKDTVRTDAYRDFIYDNKDLFRDKVVLDVGCGTGILSMFCAKAGASKVIAVDNSSIIEKARINVQNNNLQDIITCLHGKVEEVMLPVQKVDIIVSEWMGYCLLFEAMLPSVIWARDKYLKPDGLMVPSHCTLHIAPITDSEYVDENILFWQSVYGFDMSAMLEKIHDDVLVRQLKPENVIETTTFFELPLHSISSSELEFTKQFTVAWDKEVESVDGWAIWFDTFFLRSRDEQLPKVPASKWSGRGVAFTTGPWGKQTHWQSGVMLIDDKNQFPKPLKGHLEVKGTVEYRKREGDARALDIEIAWEVAGESSRQFKQTWFLQ